MSVIVRFAPSPTGKLHVGNVRTALLNYMFVREQGGEFILRIDDTDLDRSTKAYEEGIQTDLSWIGMKWDSSFNQSDKFDVYDDAAQKLREAGLLYACYETSEELDKQRKLLRVAGKPPIYNRAGLSLTDEQKDAYRQEGRLPHWRFKLSGNVVTWTDMVRGEQSIDTSSLSDPVLIRGDGTYLYTLPSVVDDIDAKITHVIRGEDHVTNSGAQIEIFRALSDHLPTFAHTPLLVGKDGKSLSKRLGSLSIEQLREDGLEPMAVCSLLGKIGTSDPVEIRDDMGQLASEFSFAKLLHDTDYADVKDRLDGLGIQGGEEFWNLIRANIGKLGESASWSVMAYAPMSGQIDPEDAEYCALAADSLPDKITPDSWGTWTSFLKETTGRKGKSLFMPLRMALMGRARGPEMDKMLMVLGAEKAKARLRGQVG